MGELNIYIDLEAITEADIADIKHIIHAFYEKARQNDDPNKSILMYVRLPEDGKKAQIELFEEPEKDKE